jgi:hypothetical protein
VFHGVDNVIAMINPRKAVEPWIAPALTDVRARLGVDAVRYSFTVVDFHRLLPAGLPALFQRAEPGGRDCSESRDEMNPGMTERNGSRPNPPPDTRRRDPAKCLSQLLSAFEPLTNRLP